MKIAIIGAGISGLTAAYHLNRQHDVHLFEAGDYVGGHTNTIDVDVNGETLAVDTGFIVFNDRTYPNFIRLLNEIGVGWQDTTMSFSVRCDHDKLEYRGADLNGFFAQRKNLVRPSFYRMLRDMLRFNRMSSEFLDADGPDISVEEFFQKHKFSRQFIQHYFLPMGAAIWSCPTSTFSQFPIRFIVEFYSNHGLLSVNDRPQWHVIRGGSKSYIQPLTRDFADRICLSSPVDRVTRGDSGMNVHVNGAAHDFDHVIFACHSDQALRILGSNATANEREILSEFPYEKNIATVHTDHSVLPKQRRAWACWNYWMDAQNTAKATVTYNMNQLQGLASRETFCVTLNCQEQIDPSKIIRTIAYEHPIFTTKRAAVQSRHDELIANENASFCGAYWGNGFHEDGVKSALAVVEKINRYSTANSPGDPGGVVAV
jgi:predicted NAD/FAD-binding protein